MQTPKLLLIVCIAALGVSSVHAQRADTDVQAKAREALRQKISETPTEQPAPSAVTPAPAPVAPAKKPAKAAAPAPVAATPAPAPAPAAETAEVVVPIQKMDSGSEDKAREALRQKIQELKTQDVAVKSAPTKAASQTEAAEPAKETHAATKHASKSNKYEFMDPSTAQPSKMGVLVANTKEGKLAELLRLYMADQITPVEYHAQRAKIIAAP